MSKFHRLMIGLSVAVVLSAGCGSGGGSDNAVSDNAISDGSQAREVEAADTTPAPGTDTAESDAVASDTVASDTVASDSVTTDVGGPADDAYLESDNPLAAYMGFDFNDTDAMVEAQRQIDERVQQCMRAQGFAYELASMSGSQTFADRGSMTDVEFAAEHGYGLADSMLEFAARRNAEADPNLALVDSMSDTERAAWETAMYGKSLDEIESASVGPPGGCFGDAQVAVFGDFSVFQQLQPALESMQDEIQADPRVVAIANRWSTCMGDAGYSFATTNDARDAVGEKIDAFLTSTDPSQPEPTDEEIQQLEKIKEEEIAIASADVACIGDDLEEMKAINREYQLRFIEDNKAVLDRTGS